ncbi:MAG: ADOP family duplicated permease [Vicinamibacterales bacterium]
MRVKEEIRDQRGIAYLDDLKRDIVHGGRVLVRSRGFAAVALTTLAMTIGATITVFTAADAWLFKPLNLPNADRVVIGLYATRERPAEPAMFVLHRDFDGWRAGSRSFEALAGAFPREYLISDRTGSQTANGLIVSGDFFSVLAVPALVGRTLSKPDATGAPSVVISYGLWERRFGRSPSVVGTSLTLNGVSHEVVGVMPRDFEMRMLEHVRGFDLWTPLSVADQAGGKGGVAVIGRLRHNVTIAAAQTELSALHQAVESAYTPNATRFQILLTTLQADNARLIRATLITVGWAVLCLLLIAAVNVGTLLLGQGMARTQEVAIRAAIGCGRARLVRQFLAESLLLSLLGGVGGIAIAYVAIELIAAWNPFGMLPATAMSLDLRAFAAALVVTGVTTVVCGVAPALRMAVVDPNDSLRASGGRGASSARTQHAQTGLLIVQMAASIVLLVATVLLGQSFLRLQNAPLGFEVNGLTAVSLALPTQEFDSVVRRRAFYDQLARVLQGSPGVQRVAAGTSAPLSSGPPIPIRTADDDDGVPQSARAQEVTAGFFDTLGIALVAGRAIDERDLATAPPVVVLNERAATQLFGAATAALGRRLRLGRESWREVIGIAHDTRSGFYNSLDWVTEPVVYLPIEQSQGSVRNPTIGYSPLHVYVRSQSAMTAADARAAVAQVSPGVAVTAVTTATDAVAQATKQPAVRMSLLSWFGTASLLLAAVGVYGLVSQGIARRMREIGIRLALGASPRDILWRVAGRALAIGAIGSVVGALLAALFASSLQNVLYGIRISDVSSFVYAVALLLTITAVAALIPAQRALKISLADILRRD